MNYHQLTEQTTTKIEDCWLCSEKLPTRRKLRTHIGGPSHHRLKVICPLCFIKEYTSNRIGDLKKHVARVHKNEVSFQSLISEGTGFYLALYPADYCRVIKPEPENSEKANKLKTMVQIWLTVVNGPTRSEEEWLDGWRQGNSTSLTAESHNNLSAHDLSQAEVNLTVGIMREENGKLVLPVIFQKEYYELVMSNTFRMNCLKNDGFCRETVEKPGGQMCCPLTGQRYTSLVGDLSHELGISECFIDGIRAIQPTMELQIPSPCHPVESAELEQTARLGNPIPPQELAKNLLEVGCMPLLPPARRKWTGETPRFLYGIGGNKIEWPPKDWQAMDADRRYQVAVHAANVLDSNDTGYPVTSSEDIMDSYNFLILPGSQEIKPATHKRKARLLNYDLVRQVAKEQTNDTTVISCFNLKKDSPQIIKLKGVKLLL